jgi:serine/threonine protein kinase
MNTIQKKMKEFFDRVTLCQEVFLPELHDEIKKIQSQDKAPLTALFEQSTSSTNHNRFRSTRNDIARNKAQCLGNPYTLNYNNKTLYGFPEFQDLSIIVVQQYEKSQVKGIINLAYFLIIPIKLSENCKYTLKMAVPILLQATPNGKGEVISLATHYWFKLKCMTYTATTTPTRDHELRPDLEPMQKLYPDFPLYFYDRPVGEKELDSTSGERPIAAYPEENVFFLISPFIQGESFEKLDMTDYTLQQKISYMLQMLALVIKAHKHGYMVKDIKPANFVLAGEIVYLIDIEQLERLDANPLQRTTSFTKAYAHPLVGEPNILATQNPAFRHNNSPHIMLRRSIIEAHITHYSHNGTSIFSYAGLSLKGFQQLFSAECAADIYSLGQVFLEFFMPKEVRKGVWQAIDANSTYYSVSSTAQQRIDIMKKYIEGIQQQPRDVNNLNEEKILSVIIKMLETDPYNPTTTTIELFHFFATAYPDINHVEQPNPYKLLPVFIVIANKPRSTSTIALRPPSITIEQRSIRRNSAPPEDISRRLITQKYLRPLLRKATSFTRMRTCFGFGL